jgi:SAM-dependent methyltransferase
MAAAPAVGLARMSNSTWTESGIGPSGLELPRLTRQWRYCRLTENLAEHEREPYPYQAMKNPTAAGLVRHSVTLGGRGLLRGGGAEAAWRVWMPLDIDRVVELPWTGRIVTTAAPGRVLDLASPKLLASWLAHFTPATVVAIDLWPAEIERWRRLIRAADPSGSHYRRLILETGDGTALNYADASFDVAYSVSVIEHIPASGDAQAMSELSRVLRPGGLLILTFPFRKQLEEEWVTHDLYGERFQGEPLFFCRHYSSEAVQQRLLGAGDFDLVEQVLWRKEGVAKVQARLYRIIPSAWPIGRMLGPVFPLIGRRAMRIATVENPGPDNVLGLVLRRR